VPRLTADILGQPASLNRVLLHQCGVGRAALLAAAARVRASRKIVIVGMGASLNAAIPLEYLLCAHGLDALSIEAGELLHYRLEAYEGATFLVVSRSGESIEIVKLLSALRGRGTTIGLTNDPDSTLARGADIALELQSLADEMVAIQTHTGTLLTLYLLGMAAINELSRAQEELEALLVLLPNWIAHQLDALTSWDPFLECDAPVYTLGRGPSYGSALQGALLFSEIAKAPAVGMAVASFRHGPVEVVDSRFRGLIFAPQGRTRELNVAMAHELVRFGGSVRLIGPEARDNATTPWVLTPSCSEFLAPMVEIVPLQMAALRLAQLRGLAVGSFRFAPQVSRDESCIAVGRL